MSVCLQGNTSLCPCFSLSRVKSLTEVEWGLREASSPMWYTDISFVPLSLLVKIDFGESFGNNSKACVY